MSKILHTYIKQYQFLTPERLYKEYIKHFETEFTSKKATVYFIVKCKRPKWVEDSIKFKNNYMLSAKITVDGKNHDVLIDMAKFWYASPDFQQYFPNKIVMANYFMSRTNKSFWKFLPEHIRYKYKSNFDSLDKTGTKLSINCEIMKNSTREGISKTDIYLYQAINYFNLPQPKLNIVYIGSSLTSTFARLQNHEKWGIIQAEKDLDEDYLIYFTEIQGDVINTNGNELSRKSHSLSKKDETRITEMALINYFKSKEFNEHHVNRDIKHTSRVKNKLIKQGYDQICVEMLLDGNLGKLGSEHIHTYGKHTIHHNLI